MSNRPAWTHGPRVMETVTLVVAAALQLPLLFLGLDMVDTGFSMTFYDNIFSHPASVQYNFMYWLTGAVGGIWESIFPGIFSLRILGLLCNLLCIWMLFRLVPDRRAVTIGSLFVLLGYYPCVILFNYDILTATMTVASLTLMGIKNKKILLSGILMGMAVFARVSNLAGIGYCLLLLLYGRKGFRMAGIWLGGWLLGATAIILTMIVLGQWPIFIANMREVFAIAGDGTASHGLEVLYPAYDKMWDNIFIVAFKFGIVYSILYITWLRLSSRLWRLVTTAGCFALYCWIIAGVTLLEAAAAIALLGCGARIIHNVRSGCPASDWMLPAMGLAMMFIMPLGSDGGIGNNGTIALWVAMPAAMVSAAKACRRIQPYLSQNNIQKVSPYAVGAAILVPFAFFAFRGLVQGKVYFDSLPVGEPKSQIASIPGVYTSPDKARRTDALVGLVKMHVAPGDTLLVYGAAPLLNYLTGTLPALGSSWPEQYTLPALDHRLANETPRYILLQRFDTYSATWPAPSDDYARGLAGTNAYHTPDKSSLILHYIRTNGYKPLDSVPDATLYISSHNPRF